MRTAKSLQDSFRINLSKHKLLYISSSNLTLTLHDSAIPTTSFPCSTAKNGLGEEKNSEKTPTGLHRISEMFGGSAPSGAIFESRQWTGEVWHKGMPHKENMILSRILRLEGLEEGHNRGGTVDSYTRYIYIHGTNQENEVGISNISHGCILLTNSDMITLFNLVEEGDYVYID